MNITKFEKMISECEAFKAGTCPIAADDTVTRRSLAERAIDTWGENPDGIPDLYPRDLKRSVDEAGIRVCLENAGVPVPEPDATNPDGMGQVIQIYS